jgi:N-acetylglutamate synthase-like GNAT family acetyltransferase
LTSGVTVSQLTDVGVIRELAIDAEADGHRMVSVLIEEWNDGTNRFDASGERLYIASREGGVAGVCGLNVDPYVRDAAVGRVRRLYVRVAQRRAHIGSALVSRIVGDATQTFERLRLRTHNPVAAAFYESHGFEPVDGDPVCTHERWLDR